MLCFTGGGCWNCRQWKILTSVCPGTNVIKHFWSLIFWDILVLRLQWKGINRKQSTRWQHLSRLKASAFFSLQIFFKLLWNTATYTWDWYCHLVGDRASLDNITTNPFKLSTLNFWHFLTFGARGSVPVWAVGFEPWVLGSSVECFTTVLPPLANLKLLIILDQLINISNICHSITEFFCF